MRALGVNPNGLSLKRVLVGGEPWSEETRRGIQDGLGVTATVTPYPLGRAAQALDDLAADRVHGAAVLHIGDLRP
jgi:hypothetical protein